MTVDSKLNHIFREFIERLPVSGKVWVAYSGGIDSTVLLHVATKVLQGESVGVIHINHQLSSSAGIWQQQAEAFAHSRGCRTVVACKVNVNVKEGGIEQAARQARYEEFAKHIEPGDLLLMGHHEQDQAETFLYRLARGAGVTGLSAMREFLPFRQGFIGRPFLSCSKQAFIDYAQKYSLNWVDDHSNHNEAFDRNYLRHSVFPVLAERWPQIAHQVSKSARLMQEHETLLNEYLTHDLESLLPKVERVGESLLLNPLIHLSEAKKNAVIRLWLQRLAYRMPSQKHLQELDRVINANHDRSPILVLQDCEIRRYRDRLYCLPKHWQAVCQIKRQSWGEFQQVLRRVELNSLCSPNITVISNSKMPGLSLSDSYEVCSLADTQGIKRGHPHDRRHSQTIKKLLQEYQVEPWLRPLWPVIIDQQKLVCAVGLWNEKGYIVADGVTLNWSL